MGAKSRCMKIHCGVPQGSVLSPALFNFFMADMPPTTGKKSNYADDVNLFDTSVNVPAMEESLTSDLSLISDRARRNELVIAPGKSSTTFFSPSTREYHYEPKIKIDV